MSSPRRAGGKTLGGEAFGGGLLVCCRRCSSLLLDLGEQPSLHRGGGALSFRIVVRETARLDDDGTQLGEATGCIEAIASVVR